MKVYIQFDFEGIAGFVIRDDQDRNIPVNLERTRRLMKIATAEVSAAADGAFAAGADEVVVWDSHGQGNTLLVEELTERAQLITGDYPRGPWLPFFEGTDVGMYIGGHAMTGTPGAVTPHTRVTVNDRDYGEVGMFILQCGSRGVPVALISGDSAVMREVADLAPRAEFVVTKEAIGPTLAKSITPARCCKLLSEGARRGVRNRAKNPPYRLSPPYRFALPGASGPEKTYQDAGDELLSAYRRYLKRELGYTRGWPEYHLAGEQYGVE